VDCSDPAGRVAGVAACLGFILLAPVVLPEVMPFLEGLPHTVRALLMAAGLLIAAGGLYVLPRSELGRSERGRARTTHDRHDNLAFGVIEPEKIVDLRPQPG